MKPFTPRDMRAYSVVELVNMILANPDQYTENQSLFKGMANQDSELKNLSTLLRFVYESTQKELVEGEPWERPTRVHLTFGPEATRETAIENLLDIFDPERAKVFFENSDPINFNDSHLERKDFEEEFNLKDK